jgi:hypothetical protein
MADDARTTNGVHVYMFGDDDVVRELMSAVPSSSSSSSSAQPTTTAVAVAVAVAAPVKEPRRMVDIIKQIKEHPQYKTSIVDDEAVRWGWFAAIGGYSWCVKENMQWVRQVWRALYLPADGLTFRERLDAAEKADELRATAASARRRAAAVKRKQEAKDVGTKRRKTKE